MQNSSPDSGDPACVRDLQDCIDHKIHSLVLEMHGDGWSTEEVLLAINDVIKMRWIDRLRERDAAAPTMSKSFISDGNEG